MTEAQTTCLIRFDDESRTYHGQANLTDGAGVSMNIVTMIAAITLTDPSEFYPLYEYVTPNALDTLISHASEKRRGNCRVEFTFDTYDIVVHDGARVVIRPCMHEEP